MILFQKIGRLFVLLLVLAGLGSCNDDSNATAFKVIGEAAIKKKLIGQDTVYARVYYAYGNQSMASATITLPEGGTLTLAASDAYKQTYFVEPDTEDFSTTVPETGTFTFKVVNESIEHTVYDELVIRDLEVPTITEVTTNVASQTITLKWDPVTDADGYFVRLLDDQNEQVFKCSVLKNSIATFGIGPASGTWSKSLESGAIYTVELNAVIYEDSVTDDNEKKYNIDEIAIGTESVVWN